jgi:hypothetical protein
MASKKVSTREIVLAVVLVAAGIWYIWYLTGSSMPGSGPGEGADALKAFDTGDAPRVRMDLLAGLAEPYDQEGRDLFKYSKRPPTAAELEAERRRLEAERLAREAALKKQREARTARQNKPRPAAPPRPSGPRPPRISFKYIGYLGPKDDRIAVFEQGEELILARVGETVQDQFRVREIEYETVVIGYTDSRFEKLSETLNQSR